MSASDMSCDSEKNRVKMLYEEVVRKDIPSSREKTYIDSQRKSLVVRLHAQIDELDKLLEKETDKMSTDSDELVKIEQLQDNIIKLLDNIENVASDVRNKHGIFVVKYKSDFASLGSVKKKGIFETNIGCCCLRDIGNEDMCEEDKTEINIIETENRPREDKYSQTRKDFTKLVHMSKDERGTKTRTDDTEDEERSNENSGERTNEERGTQTGTHDLEDEEISNVKKGSQARTDDIQDKERSNEERGTHTVPDNIEDEIMSKGGKGTQTGPDITEEEDMSNEKCSCRTRTDDIEDEERSNEDRGSQTRTDNIEHEEKNRNKKYSNMERRCQKMERSYDERVTQTGTNDNENKEDSTAIGSQTGTDHIEDEERSNERKLPQTRTCSIVNDELSRENKTSQTGVHCIEKKICLKEYISFRTSIENEEMSMEERCSQIGIDSIEGADRTKQNQVFRRKLVSNGNEEMTTEFIVYQRESNSIGDEERTLETQGSQTKTYSIDQGKSSREDKGSQTGIHIIDNSGSQNEDTSFNEETMDNLRLRPINLVRREEDYTLAGRKNPPNIIGLVVLENGRLIVADNANRCLEIFPKTAADQCVVNTPATPLSLCETGNNHIAIAFSDSKLVQRYVVSSNVEAMGSFISKYKCLAICRWNDYISLLVSNNGMYMVELRRVTDGKVLRRIDKFADENSNIHFNSPTCLLFLNDEDFLIGGRRILFCFFRSGEMSELAWYYKRYSSQNNIDKISCLAKDDKDNMYVCCKGSRNIHLVYNYEYDAEIKEIEDVFGHDETCEHKVLLSYSTVKPSAIAFDNRKNKLFVGFSSGHFEIRCYTLS